MLIIKAFQVLEKYICRGKNSYDEKFQTLSNKYEEHHSEFGIN